MKITLPGGKRDLINKASSSIFVTVAVSTIVLAFSVVAIKFLWSQMSYNFRVQSAKSESLDIIQSNLLKAKDLETSFRALDASEDLIPGQGDKANSEIVLDALPRRYDFPALRTSIDKLADLSGVDITGFSGQDTEASALTSMATPSPQEILFSVSVRGNYSAIRKFINNLDKTIRPMKLITLRFSGTDSEMGATLDMATYYQPSVDLEVQTRTIQ